MRIAIVTDAWRPQVNGVVTTLSRTEAELQLMGHEVLVINPQQFRTFPLPSYPEIRLALRPAGRVAKLLEDFRPQHIHIATEGSLGFAARNYCRNNRLNFTTAYHTQFPEYIRKRVPIPLPLSYGVLRRFHGGARRTMVATNSMRNLLLQWGFTNVVLWERGVDSSLFQPSDDRINLLAQQRPVWIYVGRVAVEKNIEAFLNLDLPGTKQVVGEGPALPALKARFRDVQFLGYQFGEQLAATIAAADVFVFPSLTDTFGLVMLEAMACGLPVAAFPVTGPVDVVKPGITGILNHDLRKAALAALELDRTACRREALKRTWQHATSQFVANLVPV